MSTRNKESCNLTRSCNFCKSCCTCCKSTCFLSCLKYEIMETINAKIETMYGKYFVLTCHSLICKSRLSDLSFLSNLNLFKAYLSTILLRCAKCPPEIFTSLPNCVSKKYCPLSPYGKTYSKLFLRTLNVSYINLCFGPVKSISVNPIARNGLYILVGSWSLKMVKLYLLIRW